MNARTVLFRLAPALVLIGTAGCIETQEDNGARRHAAAPPPIPLAEVVTTPSLTPAPPAFPAAIPAVVAAEPAPSPVPAVQPPAVPAAEIPALAPAQPIYIGVGSGGQPAAPVVTLVPVVTPSAGRRLATLYRYGEQYSEWFVRGDAAVSPSPVFDHGVRLAAWDGQDPQEVSRVAVATAVYFFSIPPDARSVAIQVGYRNTDVTQNNSIAGFLFVRDQAVERRYAAATGDTEGALDAPGFYGDTYLLPGNQVQTMVELNTDARVVDGVLEVHLSAGAGQACDVQYIQVTALAAEVPAVVLQPVTVEEIHDPYIYTYAYYYIGPWHCRYRNGYVAYEFFSGEVDPFFCGGWLTYRACFFTYHPWCWRPAYYRHGDYDERHPRRSLHLDSPAMAGRIATYRNNWYLRNFHVDARQMRSTDLDTRVRRSTMVMDPPRRAEFDNYNRVVADKVRQTDHDAKQAFGSRFTQVSKEWKRDPAAARRDLAPLQQKNPELKQPVRQLKTTPATQRGATKSTPPAPPPVRNMHGPGPAAATIPAPAVQHRGALTTSPAVEGRTADEERPVRKTKPTGVEPPKIFSPSMAPLNAARQAPVETPKSVMSPATSNPPVERPRRVFTPAPERTAPANVTPAVSDTTSPPASVNDDTGRGERDKDTPRSSGARDRRDSR